MMGAFSGRYSAVAGMCEEPGSGDVRPLDFKVVGRGVLESTIEHDLVYSFGVIHHTPHPERVIDDVRDHFVQPGSTLKIMVYHRYAWKVFWILLTYGKGALWKLDELIARHSEAQTGCPVTHTYSRRDLRRLLGGAFEVRNTNVEHIFPYRISDYVQYRYEKVWYFRHLPAPVFRWLEGRIGWHLCVTAEARQVATTGGGSDVTQMEEA